MTDLAPPGASHLKHLPRSHCLSQDPILMSGTGVPPGQNGTLPLPCQAPLGYLPPPPLPAVLGCGTRGMQRAELGTRGEGVGLALALHFPPTLRPLSAPGLMPMLPPPLPWGYGWERRKGRVWEDKGRKWRGLGVE